MLRCRVDVAKVALSDREAISNSSGHSKDREAAQSGERARGGRGDGAMVPSRSVFQTCHGRAGGA